MWERLEKHLFSVWCNGPVLKVLVERLLVADFVGGGGGRGG